MSIERIAVFLLVAYLIFTTRKALCQSCAESGRWCRDDKACCGGCCKNNACIDTYESCLTDNDPCLDNYCPPGLVCSIYTPDCKGCSPAAVCKKP